MIMRKFWLLALLFMSFGFELAAQKVVFTGKIIDADTEEGISFANVFSRQFAYGVVADEFGQFVLTLPSMPDTLEFSSIGYTTTRRAVRDNSDLQIHLQSDEGVLSTFTVLAGENPAHPIIRQLIAHKDENRLKALDTWQREDYLKVELDLTNLDNRVQKSKLLEPFEFVFQGVDSFSDEKAFLPIYVSEHIINASYTKGQGPQQNIEIARRSSGVENPTAIEAIQKVQAELDIYDNYYYFIDKSFTSPFNDQALLFYEFYLLDSAIMDGVKCWKLKFKPRRKIETTFTGECWIADSSYALVQTRMYMSEGVNINLIDRIIVYQDFSRNELNPRWIPVKQRVIVDFMAIEKTPGFIIRKTLSSKNYQSTPRPIGQKPPAYLDPDKLVQTDDYWTLHRHDSLTATEQQVYNMMDTLESLPIYHSYLDWIRTFISGYKEFGHIEIGPIAGIYSNNPVEGNRVSMGVWTSRKFSRKVQFGGYLAYGFLDDKFKGGGDITWLPKKSPRTLLKAKYRSDITSNHENSEILTDASLFSGFYRRPVPFKLMKVVEYKLSFEQFRAKGWSYKVSVLNQEIDPYGGILRNGGGFNFAYTPNPIDNPSAFDTIVNTTEIVFKLRYAPGEQYLDDVFSRTVLSNRKPASEITLARGISVAGGSYDYTKLILQYEHWLYINPFGWLSYRVRAGKVWGTVPSLLLEVAPGNETYFYNPVGFNAVNRYEFISDRFVTLQATHHFEGLLFNHIPLLRKLHWREVAVFKAMWGDMTDQNKAHNAANLFDPTKTDSYMGFRSPDSRPYLETGVGIENIFKFIRVDAVWRLNYLDHVQASRLSLRASLAFYF
jgi:Family of unknown function (DUF5686)/CarboxypepD_reg-like domain